MFHNNSAGMHHSPGDKVATVSHLISVDSQSFLEMSSSAPLLMSSNAVQSMSSNAPQLQSSNAPLSMTDNAKLFMIQSKIKSVKTINKYLHYLIQV